MVYFDLKKTLPFTFLFQVKIHCACGHLTAVRLCGDQTSEFKRLQMAQLMSGQGAAGGSTAQYTMPTAGK